MEQEINFDSMSQNLTSELKASWVICPLEKSVIEDHNIVSKKITNSSSSKKIRIVLIRFNQKYLIYGVNNIAFSMKSP